MKFKSSLLILLCFICVSSFAAERAITTNKHIKKKPHRQIHKVIDKDFADNVFLEICNQQIKFPEIVMEQALLETGWFRNHYLMSRNNLFAFKKTKYLDFLTWQRSIEYYKEWQLKRLRASEKDYYLFLVRIKYASDGYVGNLKKIHWNQSCPTGAETPS